MHLTYQQHLYIAPSPRREMQRDREKEQQHPLINNSSGHWEVMQQDNLTTHYWLDLRIFSLDGSVYGTPRDENPAGPRMTHG